MDGTFAAAFNTPLYMFCDSLASAHPHSLLPFRSYLYVAMGFGSSATELVYSLRYGLIISAVSWLLWHQWRTYYRLSQVKGPFWAQFTNL
jgi:hypothetical protein